MSKSSKNRSDFSRSIKAALAAATGYKCVLEGCDTLCVGSNNKKINTGRAAHICAASPGGVRFDPSLSPEQRNSFENGIWLCVRHHELVDSNPEYYTVSRLRECKIRAESKTRYDVSGDGSCSSLEPEHDKQEKMMLLNEGASMKPMINWLRKKEGLEHVTGWLVGIVSDGAVKVSRRAWAIVALEHALSQERINNTLGGLGCGDVDGDQQCRTWIKRFRRKVDAQKLAIELFVISDLIDVKKGSWRDLVECLLSAISGSRGVFLSICAARVLYVITGCKDGVGKVLLRFDAPQSTGVLMELVKVQGVDSLLLRYVFYLLSGSREAEGGVDVLYEVAYACDNGGLPAIKLEEWGRPKLDAKVVSFVEKVAQYSDDLDMRESAAFFLARFGLINNYVLDVFSGALSRGDFISDCMYDEICSYICIGGRLADINSLAKSVSIRPLRMSGVLALLRLFGVNRISLRDCNQPVGNMLLHGLKSLGCEFGPELNNSGVEPVRTQIEPKKRSYDDEGKVLSLLNRSRSHLIYLVRAKEKPSGEDAWYYVQARLGVMHEFLFRVRTGLHLTEYGRVMYSGWGNEPPKLIKDRVAAYADQRLLG